MPFGRQMIFLPKLLHVDEIPLSRAEGIVLDAREGEHLVLCVHNMLDEVEELDALGELALIDRDLVVAEGAGRTARILCFYLH